MTRIFKLLLAQRGLNENFLHPNYAELFDPLLMRDMKVAVGRIEQAKQRGEKIVIHGDYDVDGVTASTLLSEALVDFGCQKPEIILPDRFVDGYGMHTTVIPKIKKMGAKLVITVDCGSGSEEIIAKLEAAGIDTIVTDHHEIPQLPKTAVAVINPKRADETYGSDLAGVGVAFMLARALNMAKNQAKNCDGQEKWWLDLVAIGTICDSMQLTGDNRVLVYWGLKVLAKTRRPGLKELAKCAGIDLAKIDAHAVGFQIGPRLNAAGRMQTANLALHLLLAKDRSEAVVLADKLDELNKERRKTQDAAVTEIGAGVDLAQPVIMAHGAWHEGIVGIIAGRLMEAYQKPAFVFSELEDGIYKGSGRSFGDFSLAAALANFDADKLISGGGHALACGLTIKSDDFSCFEQSVETYYLGLSLKNQQKYLLKKSDIKLQDLSELTVELYDEIEQLAPFGNGNPEPIFEIDAKIKARKILKDKHLSLMITDKDGRTCKLIAFFAPTEWLTSDSSQARMQFTLSKNEWNGMTNIEGILINLEPIGLTENNLEETY